MLDSYPYSIGCVHRGFDDCKSFAAGIPRQISQTRHNRKSLPIFTNSAGSAIDGPQTNPSPARRVGMRTLTRRASEGEWLPASTAHSNAENRHPSDDWCATLVADTERLGDRNTADRLVLRSYLLVSHSPP